MLVYNRNHVEFRVKGDAGTGMNLYARIKDRIKSGVVMHRVLWPALRCYRTLVMKGAQRRRGIDGNKVVFSSFLGSAYNDNPRYISEMLHSMRPGTDIVWLYRDGRGAAGQEGRRA